MHRTHMYNSRKTNRVWHYLLIIWIVLGCLYDPRAVPEGAAEGVSIPLDGKVPLTTAQLRLLDEVTESGSCALIAPGDLGVFHASNYHAVRVTPTTVIGNTTSEI